MENAEYPPAHPGSGPWWLSPQGWGQGRGQAPSPQAAELAEPPLRPGTMNSRSEPVGLSPIAPRQGSRPFSEAVDD